MDSLRIEKTNSTPSIVFNPETGLLQIKGESFPENVAKFYGPVMDWIKGYLDTSPPEVRFEFEIIYFNSSTSKVFMTLFDLLDEEAGKGLKIEVVWRCDRDNEIGIEYGEEFSEDLNILPFRIEVF